MQIARVSEAGTLALRLIDSLGAPYGIDGNQINVAVTIGITIAPTDGTEPEVLMKNANLALCRAKADGGATYRYFEPELDARMRERRILELDLHKAIAGRVSELYYQPVVDIRSGQIVSCEALLVGIIRNAAWSHRQTSFRSRKKLVSSYRWGSGCSATR